MIMKCAWEAQLTPPEYVANPCYRPAPLHNGDLVGKSCNLKQKNFDHKNKTKFANAKQKEAINKKAKSLLYLSKLIKL